MIMGPANTCPMCNKEKPTFWAGRQQVYMCAECQRIYNPPFMTLVRFSQGNYKRLWNIEVGAYEDFDKVSAIELCDWNVRSTQETIYSLVPRVKAWVYHLEYNGEIKCGRCVDYPYFGSEQACLSQACQKLAMPWRAMKDRQYPHERSRYVKWTNRINL
jgi:hypothetical protein